MYDSMSETTNSIPVQDLLDPSMDSLNVAPLDLTDEETAERAWDLARLYEVAQVRESPHPQFDDMGYMKYNETNEMADISYIPRKTNKMDTRMTSGITHEKDSSILALLQSFNFECRVRVFDQDKEELYSLSDAMTAMLRKSRELEKYDEKRPIYYRNLLVQGTAFVREKYVQRWVPKKVITSKDIQFNELDAIKWTNAGFECIYEGCVSELVDGKKVFMEDIRQQDKDLQPGIWTIQYVPRVIVASIWKDAKRWKYVPKQSTGMTGQMLTNASRYADWTLGIVDYTKIEVIEVFRPFDNRYQVYLNGVPMLDAGFPLTAISPSGCMPIAKGDLDPMNMFAYSKSIPAKTKVDQAVYDSTVKVMNVKFEQGAFPPSGNLTGKVLSPYVFMPGRMTPNLRPDDLPALMQNVGITPADFNYVNFIQQQINSKSISSILDGTNSPGSTPNTETLGEYELTMQRAMLKLGGIFDAVINWEKQMAHLRVQNIIANWTTPIDQDVDKVKGELKQVYKTVTVDDTFEDGKKGLRVIQFTPFNKKSSMDIHNDEMDYAKKTGKEVRYSYINPNLLRDMDFHFYYEVIPVDKNNDESSQKSFIMMIQNAIALFGPQSLNVETLKKQYAYKFNQDFDKMFTAQAPGAPQMPMQMQPGQQPNQMQPNMPSPMQPQQPGMSIPGQVPMMPMQQ